MTAARRELRLRPRKEPRQDRARATRARILDAAAEVVEAHGYDAGTTNRIAEAAGLSVGSLYQYFPNKDAILVDLLAAHVAEGVAQVHHALAELAAADAPLVELVHAVLAELLALHRRSPVLHQVLMTRTPLPPDVAGALAGDEAHLAADLAAFLATRPELALPDPDVAARMVVTTANALVHAQVTQLHPAVPDDRFVQEATHLLVAYLQVPRA